MNDIQRLFDAVSDSNRRVRSGYHLTLGDFIKKLKAVKNKNKTIKTDMYDGIGECMSYRGYYADLSFEPTDKICTVEEVLPKAEAALGNTYEGYKGGDFTMGEDTPLWIAHYSDTGRAVIGFVETDDSVLLVTKEIE